MVEGLFSFLVQKSASKVLKTWYFTYSVFCILHTWARAPPPRLRYWQQRWPILQSILERIVLVTLLPIGFVLFLNALSPVERSFH